MTRKLRAGGFFSRPGAKSKKYADRLDGTKTLVAAWMLTKLARNGKQEFL
ncbi:MULTISPECIES: hypothetical protein [unclassified Rhizobium]|jgi:hypothetical protein|nr:MULTISPECIES: hypothetical protein [unclassified Rhizobium]RKD51992.1 hypothetical protein BJ928_11723 [Rhizobium sp. WW_1]